MGGRLGLRCTGEGLPHPSPPLWIPAFAGMTRSRAGITTRQATPSPSPGACFHSNRSSRLSPARQGTKMGLHADGVSALLVSPLPSPLDSGLRRNDECRAGCCWETGLASDALEALPYSPPPLWIPAFAGMTMVGAGVTNGGPALLGRWVGLRCIEEGLPCPSPPLWIPAFAGMTNVGPALLGRWVGLRCTEEGLPHPSPPLWIPAFAGMTKGRARE